MYGSPSVSSPLERKIMFRIAFTIGLTLTVCSLSVNASPQAQAAENEKKAEDNYLKIAKQIITRYDQNADSQLNAEEWEKMLLSPAGADANKDQQITITEYAKWARSKDRSKKPQAKSKTKVSDSDAKPAPHGYVFGPLGTPTGTLAISVLRTDMH